MSQQNDNQVKKSSLGLQSFTDTAKKLLMNILYQLNHRSCGRRVACLKVVFRFITEAHKSSSGISNTVAGEAVFYIRMHYYTAYHPDHTEFG